jgi:hypothetical protein
MSPAGVTDNAGKGFLENKEIHHGPMTVEDLEALRHEREAGQDAERERNRSLA